MLFSSCLNRIVKSSKQALSHVRGRVANAASVAALALVALASPVASVASAETLASGTAAQSESEQAFTVVVLGDSISAAYGIQREEGWVTLLDARLQRNYPGSRVINASVSGETTGGGLARLPAVLAANRVDLVIVELGGNDGLRGYPIKTIAANLEKTLALAQQSGAATLLLGMQIPPNYGPRYTRAFHQVFHDVANASDTPLLPFLLERVAINPELMQDDGIHPTAEAQDDLLDTAWPLINKALDKLTTRAGEPAATASP